MFNKRNLYRGSRKIYYREREINVNTPKIVVKTK